MKAVVCEKYGNPEVLHLQDRDKPVPGDNELLIKVIATTVTAADSRVRSLRVPSGLELLMRLALGFTRPRQSILGSELAGYVEAVGKNVRKFRSGDYVFAFSDIKMGSYVEYKTISEDDAVAHIPSGLNFNEAAALSFGGTTALYFLRKAKLKPGEQILVIGASGSVGTAAVQLAKYFGAEVTAVCSAANADMVGNLGASHVIDYTREDYTKNGKTYDVIVDASGTIPFSRNKLLLKSGGRLLPLVTSLLDMLVIPWVSMFGSKKILLGTASGKEEDLRFLADLAEKGVFRPVIDKVYPFEKIVAAHRYVDTGHKKGNVVVTVAMEKQKGIEQEKVMNW